MAVRQLESGRCEVENQYVRAVRRDGNREAQRVMAEVFRVADRPWRGLGPIPASGLLLSEAYAGFDAAARFDVGGITTREHPECIAGQILTGARTPLDCPAYGVRCTPRNPLGAPMVSGEGTCAAYFSAGRARPARAETGKAPR
jgi:hydrogenase expression/formation protein HypD